MKPRQYYLILYGIFLISLPLGAQEFKGGAVAGLTASQVDGDTFSGFDKLGFTAGAYVYRMLGRQVSAQMEIRYTMKGATDKGSPDDPNFYLLVLHYAELPLALKYHYQEKVILEAGLSPDYTVTYREEDETGILPEEEYKPFHKFGLSAFAGIGYRFLDRFTAAVRYSYSAIPIRPHSSGQTYLLNRGQYNNVLLFSIYFEVGR